MSTTEAGAAGATSNMSHTGVLFGFGQHSPDWWPVCARRPGRGRQKEPLGGQAIRKRTGRDAVDDAEQAEVAESDGRTPDGGQEKAPGGVPGGSSSGGRRKVPYWLSQVPYALVLSALAAGIVVVAAAYFKRGPAIIAGALLLAATFRLFLPKDWIGLLAVRRRWVDLLTLVSLALLLIVLAWVAPQLSA